MEIFSMKQRSYKWEPGKTVVLKIKFSESLPALGCILFFLLSACSSAPKTPPENYALRNEAAQMVQLGAKALRDGQDVVARQYYTEAYRIYTAVDDPEGRIRALDGLGRIASDGKSYWEQALRIGEESENKELIALATMLKLEYIVLNEPEQIDESVKVLALDTITALNDRPLDKARGLRIYGTMLKTTSDYQGAIGAYTQAAEIDKKHTAYIELASDNYLLASVYSKMEQYPFAIQYLNEALQYDRKMENSSGIGSDYFALGLVYDKTGNVQKAQEYYSRAEAVYAAARMKKDAEEAHKKQVEKSMQ